MKTEKIDGCYKSKNYVHFDFNRKIENIKLYVENPLKISRHPFYPFILDKRIFKKYKFDKEYLDINDKIDDEIFRKEKIRDIMFSAHIDRYIYQYYNLQLNKEYNMFVKAAGINECPVAYRNNLKKNNIHISKEVFANILKCENCYIIVGDFTKFFDNLDHKYLKAMLCKLLKVGKLSDDYYAVYKNITKYSYFYIDDLCTIGEMKKQEFYNSNDVFDINKMKENKKEKLQKNDQDYGIPQGSAISSALSNIYMIDCDISINKLVSSLKGIYRRYSDDFIIILPEINDEEFKKVIENIHLILNENGKLQLENDKTKVYKYNNKELINIDKECLGKEKNSKNDLDYLGFTFDGINVKIRDKTMSKFYNKMYGKIKTIAISHGISKNGNKITMQELYRLYSKKGIKTDKGNFLSYNERCEKIYKDLGCFISYKKRFMSKLKVRYNKMMKKYKNINTMTYYSTLYKPKKK